MIWYLWLGGRFLEYGALGFLNEDHWVARKNLPCGVGGESVYYFGYHLRKLSEKFKYFLADDVAGWDTRLSVADLEDELEFLLSFEMSERQRALISSVYKLLYIIKVALVTRDQRVMLSNVAYDILVRLGLGQRGSGQIITYALNTITNAKVQLGRMLENHGIYAQLGPFINNSGELGWQNRAMVERIVTMVLDKYANEWLEAMLVAGDDVVVATNCKDLAGCLMYINNTGKIRKNIGMWDPSRIFGSWEEVEFCSHHFHELWLKGGRLIVVPCRDQNEVLGRGRIQKGGVLTMESGACNLKAYGKLWLLYFFHRRDLRLLALFICSVVPNFWMPTGLTSWSIHQKKEWMTNHDMLRIWNQVWVTNNPHMREKAFVYSWGDLPYLPKGKDLKCGSLIGDKERAKWAKILPDAVTRIRYTSNLN